MAAIFHVADDRIALTVGRASPVIDLRFANGVHVVVDAGHETGARRPRSRLAPTRVTEADGGVVRVHDAGGSASLHIERLAGLPGIAVTYDGPASAARFAPALLRLIDGLSPERVYVDGYQSWSPPFVLSTADRQPTPRYGLGALELLSPVAPRRMRPGAFWSDGPLLLLDAADRGLLLGAVTAHRLLSGCCYDQRERTLAAWSFNDVGCPRAASETFILAASDDGWGLLAAWASCAGRRMEAITQAPAPEGWCTWYQYFTKVEPSHIVEGAQRIRELAWSRPPMIQLDDGYQRAVGAWTQTNDRFPDGTAALPGSVERAGGVPGIWIAPLLTRDPGFPGTLHDTHGRPVSAGVNPNWGGRTYALDPTSEPTLNLLERTFTQLHGEGYRYFKLDFLYAGTLAGRRAGASTVVEAYREVLRRIREWAPGATLCGCGAPLLPSVGLVETMRVGVDVDPRWIHPISHFMGASFGLGSRNALLGTLQRPHQHRRLWVNDPDCVLLRDRSTHLTPAQIRTMTLAVCLTGGAFILSDAPEWIPRTRQRWLAQALPVSEHGMDLVDIQAGVYVLGRDLIAPQRGRLVLVVNLRGCRVRRSLPRPPGTDYVWLGERRHVRRAPHVLHLDLGPHRAEVIAWIARAGEVTFLGDGARLDLNPDPVQEQSFDRKRGCAELRLTLQGRPPHRLRLALGGDLRATAASWGGIAVPFTNARAGEGIVDVLIARGSTGTLQLDVARRPALGTSH